MSIKLARTVLNVAGCCNLKCKNCLAFIPYYKEKWIMSVEEAERVLEKYFEVVDEVDTFTVTGGEPLLNPNLLDILNAVMKYVTQINYKVDLVTNATIAFSDEFIQFFKKNKGRARVILSDYGPELSKQMNNNEKILIANDCDYRVSSFHGDDLYFDGWIDFSDHSLKWKDIESREINASKCIHSAGKYYVINDGCIHRCSRSYWRMKQGIIPYTLGEYVPLTDDKFSLEDKRRLLNSMLKLTSSTSCAYCVGLRNDVPRVKPAIQLD